MVSRLDPYASFRFVVEIEGVSQATFTQCTLPTLEVEVEEQKEGGFNTGTHLLPGRVRKGTITLKRGLVTSSELLQWYADVMQGNLDKARRSVSVVLYDAIGDEVMRWDFTGVFPHKWSGPTLNAASNEVAIETLELSFESVSVS